jgi:hypothetical protein
MVRTLRILEALFQLKGIDSLLPQNLTDDLLNEVCGFLKEFQNYTFSLNNPLKAFRDMDEIINPVTREPYADVTLFLLKCFCGVKNNDELVRSLKEITKDEPSGTLNIFLTLQGHYLLEQIRRKEGVNFKPFPSVDNILNKKKRSTRFSSKGNYRNECENWRYHCYRYDMK